MIASRKLIIKKPKFSIRLQTSVTWTELGLWAVIIVGGLLGTLKRYAPGPSIAITIGYDALCFGLLAYVIIKRLWRSWVLPYSQLTPALTLFVGFAALTIFNPILTSVVRGAIGWRFLASGIVLHFLGFYAFYSFHRVQRFLNMLWGMGAVVGLYGLVQLIRGYTAVELDWINNLAAPMKIAGTGRYRLMGTMSGAFDLSFFMALNINTLMGHILSRRSTTLIHILAFLLMVNALIFTFVRTSWIAVVVGCAYLFTMLIWQNKRFRLLMPALFSLNIFLMLSLLQILPVFAEYIENPALKERVASLANPLEDKSVINRFDRWQETWDVVEEYPMGLGVGMTGATSLRYPNAPSPASVTMDNSYLKVLVETGWLGLFLYLLLLGSVIVKGIKIASSIDKKNQMLAYSIVAIFFSFCVLQMFGEYVELNPSRSLIWILSGILFSLPRYQAVK